MKKSKNAIDTREYLAALSETEPCGPNLEYDPEYVALQTRMIPKGDAQYGDFVKAPEEPNWGEVERECLRMLSRSRDITILLLLLRCRIHLVQAKGLREVLEILLGWFEHYPEHVHPQLVIDGEHDPSVRANALLALVDPEGALGELRELALAKSSAMRLQIRDVERAFAVPRPNDALAPDSVCRQLNDLAHSGDANVLELIDSARLARRLREWLLANMQEYAPNLEVFFRLLDHFYREGSEPFHPQQKRQAPDDAATSPSPDAEEETEARAEDETSSATAFSSATPPASFAPTFAVSPEMARENALHTIRNVREWFEQYEPSSPVSVLLRQAERMIGKKFSEVAQEIPYDLLERWSGGDDR
ncbi:MAG: type VI secretion system ImpA family N-terminal domain-containing protein [Zoogloeaceae bacterium]|jgi:type VI secretion system protein ImpA|nr:type VI secretion system ImpA family N-terminal domain-containing protein [Zoogloeaceae bacterium]